MSGASGQRRWSIPSMIQTSALDCGPATVKAILAGFGVEVHYGRLREACQIDVDGTSIDVIEDLLLRFGLAAAQYIVPVDHLLMPAAGMLPCLMITRLPSGFMHFVVLWRTLGPFVQVMDPAHGRAWKTREQAVRDAFVHRFPASAALAREWLSAPAFLAPLRRRLADLGVPDEVGELLVDGARTGPDWLPLAALDAATRLVTRLVASGAVRRGTTAQQLVERLADSAGRSRERAFALIPARDWSVAPLADDQVELRGVVIVHVAGRAAVDEADLQQFTATFTGPSRDEEARPLRSIAAAAWAESRAALVVLPLGLVLAGAGVAIEVLLFQGLIRADQVSPELLTLVALFLAIGFTMNLSLSAVLLHLGRWLDVHLRVRLLEKLPRLGNYYFHSRLTSDLAYRAHELRALRGLPQLAAELLRILAELLLTTAGLVWLLPGAAAPAALAMLVIVGLPFVLLLIRREQELRISTQLGALSRFYLDALLGLTPIQAHCSETAVRSEHEALLADWAEATRAYYRLHLLALGVMTAAGTAFALWTITAYFAQADHGYVLLVVYWSLRLPMLAQDLAETTRRGPGAYNRLLRLFEVLGASEEGGAGASDAGVEAAAPGRGVAVEMRGVTVVAGGHTILQGIDLDLRPGEHVAIVGPSGSGKTSLIGLLLGWHRAASGSLAVDGGPLDAGRLTALRRATAWVDPAVQLWNRSLAENVRYGAPDATDAAVRAAIAEADVDEIVARLPGGLAGELGEGGGLVSGGEGQRVRLARAMLRTGVRLAILDEPFRGLDGDTRRALLAVARRHWEGATLLYVSHDIDTSLAFDRVLVLADGVIVEDGAPAALLARPDSRLAALAAAQRAVDDELWGDPVWRRWQMAQGELR